MIKSIMLHFLIPKNSKIIIGLSGGPDSVYLLHHLVAMQKEHNLTLIAAHLDHEWRSDSANDVRFCTQLCAQLDVPFVSTKASELDCTIKYNGSKEAHARALRRHFFKTIQKEHNADLIALAHHAQDQQETFFIRLLRGASLSGLIGMQPKNGAYIRPLLETNKADILHYVHTHNIAYLTDPSNQSDAFLRNRIRNHVIPALNQADNRFNHNFARTLDKLNQANDFMNQLAQQAFDELIICQDTKKWLNVRAFLAFHPVLQQRILIAFLCDQDVPFIPSDALFAEMIRFFKQPGNKTHRVHPQWQLEKKNNLVRILK